jgi:hypothetical protein
MTLAVYTQPDWNGLKVVTERFEEQQKDRILAVLGMSGGQLPTVDDESLQKYYRYLSANLSFPFTAHYPEPTSPREEELHRCEVLELIDPTRYISDDFSGVFCRTRKGDFEVNLPLVELEVPQDSANFQLVEDYWYWFWNWR